MYEAIMVHGERIRLLRMQRALSQSALGKLLAKDGQYVSKLERGVLSSVTTETLERLADTLGCSTDYLLGRVLESSTAPAQETAHVMKAKRQRTRKAAPVA
jgi:transcriptional regulator with XRE-family HTH domain